MTSLQIISSRFWRWMDDVAAAVIAIIERVGGPRVIRLVEEGDGQFSVQLPGGAGVDGPSDARIRLEGGKVVSNLRADVEAALRGGSVELALRSERFLFRPLDLPARAAEFLDGVVRGQIDRLTPWDADHAAFGWSKPADAGAGRIIVTIAATAKAVVAPYLQAFAGLGIRSITVSTRSSELAAGLPITIAEENLTGVLDVRRVRRILFATLAVGLLIATGAAAAVTIMSGSLEARQDELARRVAERRSASLAARNVEGDPATAAERALARRKYETPSSVIVLEVLSQILPDHTYVTELRIEADKLRVVGITQDAPALIRLIEQSQHFARATFFAPTTRAPSDMGDRFNIEARIVPLFSPRS
jgi:general secretion pathway protein L